MKFLDVLASLEFKLSVKSVTARTSSRFSSLSFLVLYGCFLSGAGKDRTNDRAGAVHYWKEHTHLYDLHWNHLCHYSCAVQAYVKKTIMIKWFINVWKCVTNVLVCAVGISWAQILSACEAIYSIYVYTNMLSHVKGKKFGSKIFLSRNRAS